MINKLINKKMILFLNQYFHKSDKQIKAIYKYNQQLIKLKQSSNNQSLYSQKQKQIIGIHNELHSQLVKQEQRKKQQYIKDYLIAHLPKQPANNDTKQPNQIYIPNGLVLKKLVYRQKQTLLCGVIAGNEQHSIFTKKIIQNLKIANCIVTTPPDLPFFIKTQKSFLEEWKQFLESPNKETYKFYINPIPKTFNEIIIRHPYIAVVKHAFLNTKQFHLNLHHILKENNHGFQPYPMFAPFIANGVKAIYFAGMPLINQRQQQAKGISLAKLREVFEVFKKQKQKPKTNFDPSLLFPQKIMKQKLDHIINITKRVSSILNDQRSILICSVDQAQNIGKQWKINSKDITDYFYFEDGQWPEMTMIEFIQKLVLLEMMTEPVLDKYYVKYQSFPYLCKQVIGGNQHLGKVFMIWKYYHDLYSKALKIAQLKIPIL